MMRYKQQIDRIDMSMLCQYLIKRDWQPLSDLAGGKIKQFIYPNSNDVVYIPLFKDFSDYYEVVNNSLQVLSVVENSPIRSIYNKLINPSSDLLQWRISDDMTSRGEISFNVMQANIEYIKDLLSTTCIDILTPRTLFHKKVQTKDVVKQIDTYRFGQTEIGSYILNIICPLGYYQYKLFDAHEEELPLSRKINLKIFENIHTIQQSIKENSSLADDYVAEGNISVNFLNSLTKLYEENINTDVYISASWNRDVPNPSLNPITAIQLEPRCIEGVVYIAEKYTPKTEQNIRKAYYGKITNIAGAAEVESREKLNISVAAIGDEGRKITVKVELDNAQYSQLVTEAFNFGEDVRVEGLQILKATSIRLENATIEKLV